MDANDQVPQLRAALDRVSARFTLLTEASGALASSLDGREALHRLARLVVPQLAGACVMDVVEEGRVRRAEVSAREQVPLLPAPAYGSPADLADQATALGRVLRGSGPTLVSDVVQPTEPGSAQHALLALYRALGAGTALVVPMRVRREVLGAVTLVRGEAAEPFDKDDQSLAEDLAHRAALALDNARLYALHQSASEQLQRSLLPDLSGLPGLPLAARYVPARDRAQVGGDWYDAFPLPGGSVVLAIGDVMGHDLAAAVHMGQLRNMLRALAYDSRAAPDLVVRRLDRVMQGLSAVELVTGVLARLDCPASGPWTLTWTNAGHPPPLLAWDDGRTELLEGGRGLALGVDPGVGRQSASVALPPGATLLFYTDGLIERPGEDLGLGLTRLRQHAKGLVREDVQTFCDEVLGRLATGYHDDVALLALRVPGGR